MNFNSKCTSYTENIDYKGLLNEFKNEFKTAFLEELKIYINKSRAKHFPVEVVPNVKDDFVEKADKNFEYLLNEAIKTYRNDYIVPPIEKKKNDFLKEMNLRKNQSSIHYYLEKNFEILIKKYTGTEEQGPKYLDSKTIEKKFEALLKNIVFINDFSPEFQDYVRSNDSKRMEIKASSAQKTDDPIRLEFHLFFEFFSQFLLEKFLDKFKSKNLSSTIKKMKGVLEYAGFSYLESKLKNKYPKEPPSIETIHRLSKEFSKIYKNSLFDRIVGGRKTEINEKNRSIEIKKCIENLPHLKGQIPLIGQIYDRLINSYLNPSRKTGGTLVEPFNYDEVLTMLNAELIKTSKPEEEDDLD
jgi:hypothetical protein